MNMSDNKNVNTNKKTHNSYSSGQNWRGRRGNN
jgi:hypothetical protein